MDQAEIINSIVKSFLEEPVLVDDPEWDTFAAAGTVTSEMVGVSAYRYRAGEPGTATPIRNSDVLDLFRELQSAIVGPDDQTWEVCIVKIERDSARGSVNFVYPEEAGIWRVDPADPRRLAENLRPRPEDFN